MAGTVDMPLPALIKLVVPVVSGKFEKLIEMYTDKLIKHFGGEVRALSLALSPRSSLALATPVGTAAHGPAETVLWLQARSRPMKSWHGCRWGGSWAGCWRRRLMILSMPSMAIRSIRTH